MPGYFHLKGQFILKIFEIYFRDLVPEAQEAALSFFGVSSPQDANWDSFPISTIEVYDEHSDVETICPLGGDTKNDCEGCAYPSGFHFADGECDRRSEK